MAFIDVDSSGEPFVNVTHRTGARGDWDDLLAVQGMLKLVYTYNPVLNKSNPLKEEFLVTGKPSSATSTLISHFQRHVRKKPVGYLDKAFGKNKDNYTIWTLNSRCSMILAVLKYAQGKTHIFLRTHWPLLEPMLRD